MQFVLIVVAIAAAILFIIRPSGAYEGPWCAGTNRGGGTFVYDCSMRTLEQCIPEVIAGNRGFCSPNPKLPRARGQSAQGQAKTISLLTVIPCRYVDLIE
jgi:hypothetical protein